MLNVFFPEVSECLFKSETKSNSLSLIPDTMISNILSGLGMERLVSKNVCSVDVSYWDMNGGEMVDTLIILLFFAQMKVRGEFTVLSLPPLLSSVQARMGGGSADPQSPHKELRTIKKVETFYTDLHLCSVWGLILVAPRAQ